MSLGFSVELPSAIACALERLENAGHEGWLVGGCVRDAVMGVQPHDYDITTSAMPGETISAFEGFRIIETGLKHGTVTVLIDGEPIEITTFRTEGDYLDNRHPSTVSFTRCIEDDLMRRDFTFNAMAYHPQRGLLDLYGGCEDIKNRRVSCVGDARERFCEDGLRILRALRFASRLGFSLDDSTDSAVRELAGLLKGISAERVFSELCGILCGCSAGETVYNYAEVISVIIPEFTGMIGFEQNSKYHCYDLLEHTCRAIDASPQDRLVRLALLLHDIGKPQVRYTGEDGYDHYIGHQDVGANMADEILRRLKSDTRTRKTIVRLIEMHDCPVTPDEKRARRMLRELSLEDALMLMDVKAADRAAHAEQYNDPSDIYRMKEILQEVAASDACFSLADLEVSGSDIIELGISPGPVIGSILNRLLEMVINAETENNRDELLAIAARIAEEYTVGE